MDNAALKLLLRRWFADGAEASLAECLRCFRSALAVPSAISAVLGSAEAEDVLEDLLIKLLDRQTGTLREAEQPLAFARVCLRRTLLDRLRARLRQSRLGLQVLRETADVGEASPHEVLELVEQLRQATEALAALTPEQRLAVTLTTFAERVSPSDRSFLHGHRGAAALPRGALSVEEASALLFGVADDETAAQRRQRSDRFHKLHARALAALRRRLANSDDDIEGA